MDATRRLRFFYSWAVERGEWNKVASLWHDEIKSYRRGVLGANTGVISLRNAFECSYCEVEKEYKNLPFSYCDRKNRLVEIAKLSFSVRVAMLRNGYCGGSLQNKNQIVKPIFIAFICHEKLGIWGRWHFIRKPDVLRCLHLSHR